MSMSRQNNTTFSAGKRIGVSDQPLNVMPAIRLKYLVLTLLIAGASVLLFQNKDSLAQRMSSPITKVRVENQWQSISEAEVQQIIGKFMGVGYFDFDVQGVRQVLEAHHWIRYASVKKIWPDSVGLQLTEEVAIARWNDSQLLNQYGEIFRPDYIEHLSALPLLTGPNESQAKVMEQYRAVNQLFFQAGLRVTSLAYSERGNWTLVLNDQMQINAGRVDVMNRLARFIDFYSSQSEAAVSTMVAVDLRYENGMAVKHTSEELSGVAVR